MLQAGRFPLAYFKPSLARGCCIGTTLLIVGMLSADDVVELEGGQISYVLAGDFDRYVLTPRFPSKVFLR